jgi:hypothetical protein
MLDDRLPAFWLGLSLAPETAANSGNKPFGSKSVVTGLQSREVNVAHSQRSDKQSRSPEKDIWVADFFFSRGFAIVGIALGSLRSTRYR